MKVNLTDKGLKEIVNDFDLFYIDIWGVLHNGIQLNEDAVNVLSKLDDLGKEYVLLTNAPRPNLDVIKFLNKLGLDDKNIFNCPVTIIDPNYKDHDNRLVTTIFNPQMASEYLTYLRTK